MNITKYLKLYKNEIPKETCDLIIQNFIKDEATLAIDGVVTGDGQLSYRSDEFLIGKDIHLNANPDWRQINQMLYQAYLLPCITKYLVEIEANYISSFQVHTEDTIISRYPKNLGHFAPHQDSTAESPYLRSLTTIVYFNTIDEGGTTEFFNLFENGQTLKIKPEVGSILIFPSNFIFAHRGNVPVSADKFIYVIFTELHVRANGHVFKVGV